MKPVESHWIAAKVPSPRRMLSVALALLGAWASLPISAEFVDLQRKPESAVVASILPLPARSSDRDSLGATGSLSIAILSSSTFDATLVDAGTVVFAGAPAVKRADGRLSEVRDVNGDGLDDLVVAVAERRIRISPEGSQAALIARTRDRRVVTGSAPIVPDAAIRRAREIAALRPHGPEKQPPMTVRAVISPGKAAGVVAIGEQGPIAVAILGDDTFDASHVDPETITLDGAPVARAWNGQPRARIEDADGDGRADMLVSIVRESLQPEATAPTAILRGLTWDGRYIVGHPDLELRGERTVTFRSECTKKGAPASTEFASAGGITINDLAPATPYPSTIAVSGLVGKISRVRVTLKGLTHAFPADVDVLLVAPTGQSVKILADTGGNAAPASPVTITFDDTAAELVPPAGPLTSGIFRPTDFAPADAFPAPAPGGPAATSLSALNGIDPNGTWSLFVVDDLAGDAGAISGGWSLDFLMASEFCSAAPIGIFDNAVAAPYPVPIQVTGLTGQIVAKVTATLRGLTHPRPEDIDALLVGPQGQSVALISDMGWGGGASGVTLTFDDDASGTVPNPFVSGTYWSFDRDPGDPYPAPAPAGPTSDYLSVFNGDDPNGTWNLFVVDDSPSAAGVIQGGYCLSFTTVAPTTDCNLAPLTIPSGAPGATTGPAGPYPSSVTVAGMTGVVDKATVTLNGLAHTFPDDLDVLLVGPSGRAIVLMSDAGGDADLNGITITFDDDAVASLPDAAGIAAGTYKPTDHDPGDAMPAPAPAGPHLTLLSQIASGSPNGTWSLYVYDDLTGDVGALQGGWCLTFRLRVDSHERCGDGVTIPAGAPGATSGPASLYPTTIEVSGISEPIGHVRVWLGRLNHTYPDDLDVLLVGPRGQKMMLMSDAGGNVPVSHNLWIAFEDAFPDPLPDTGVIDNGGFHHPTDFEPGDAMPAPAPAGPYPNPPLLAAWDHTDPNGTWSLYINDDAAGDVGSMGNWCLTFYPQDLPPGDVDLRWAPGTKDTLEWSAAPLARTYNVYTGTSFDLPRLLNCHADSSLRLATAGTTTGAILGETPRTGGLYWYLVRASNATGEGPAGKARVGASEPARLQSTSGQCTCSHDKCSPGGPLGQGCEPCVTKICANDPFCCGVAWDNTCVEKVYSTCRDLVCTTGACAHKPCSTGGPLAPGCDNPPVTGSCVAAVCAADAFCCAVSWDDRCVSELASVCGLNCD